jgi:hypothetical protein
MMDEKTKSVPVGEINNEEGSEELAHSERKTPYLDFWGPQIGGQDIEPYFAAIPAIPLEERPARRVADLVKAFVGRVGYVLFLLLGLTIVGFGLHHLDSILRVATKIADFSFGAVLFCLLLAIIPTVRRFAGTTMMIASYFLGLNVWLGGVYTVYALWGLVPLIGGLIFLGIGPVPMGLVALLIHHQPSEAGWLFLGLAITFIVRLSGSAIASSGEMVKEKKEFERQIINEWRERHREETSA